jgi:hypothetical protein
VKLPGILFVSLLAVGACSSGGESRAQKGPAPGGTAGADAGASGSGGGTPGGGTWGGGAPGAGAGPSGGGGGGSGGTGGHSDLDAGSAAPIAAACSRLAAASCARLITCSPENVAHFYGTQADCLAIETAWCENTHAMPGVQGGAAEIDRLAAEVQQRSCALHVHRAHYHYTTLPGVLPVGTDCVFAPQCASGICEHAGGECGTCVAAAAPSGPCQSSTGTVLCRDGSLCNSATGRCEPLPGENQPCLDQACAAGLVCGKDVICRRLRFLGEDCEPDHLTCFDLTCDLATRKCVRPERNPEGSACGGWPEFQGECERDLACVTPYPGGDAPGICRPYSRLGADCGWACPGRSVCIDGTCQVPSFAKSCP